MEVGKHVWPVVGLVAVLFSAWLLYGELRNMSLDDLWDSLTAISLRDWLLAIAGTLLAYAALAGYDHVALLHLRRHVDWRFVTVCSFTTYALSHNIGASVFSGGLVRYRAYKSRGLSGSEVGILVALCSVTFALGAVILMGAVLILEPEFTERFADLLPLQVSTFMGVLLLLGVALYMLGSFLKLPPLKLGSLKLEYPRPEIVLRQLVVGPIELIGAAAIIYFTLPETGNPGFVVVLGIFLTSFCAALLSHAPGGLGVLELVFIIGLPEMAPEDVLAALLVFRLLYLLIPLAVALLVVLGFERGQFLRSRD
ncbi:YbhN family protein [Mesorhizobium sp. BAC0120]|uniref:lysylphosphatidylglycerol synthase transmembrane domain-containing protein n=1 Tax=Mesorhizobium sp. BAC0120 TaxID=3090670 RepID=UPI00298C7036|nr:YbhN family protein [Mesorhizobium sp. BAC0120]MDW6023540.1 YbhN family protein [Mesorhizobium sp. BAC0120]